MINEPTSRHRHTRKTRRITSLNRAARQPVAEYDVKHNFTRFIGRFRQMTWKDKDELKSVVESLKAVNVH